MYIVCNCVVGIVMVYWFPAVEYIFHWHKFYIESVGIVYHDGGTTVHPILLSNSHPRPPFRETAPRYYNYR